MDPMGMLDMIPAGTPFFREKNKYPLDKLRVGHWQITNSQWKLISNPLWHLC